MAPTNADTSPFLGLTTQTLRRHPPPSVAMAKGHLDEARKKTKSALSAPIGLPTLDASNAAECAFPSSEPGNHRTHHCFASVVAPATGQSHTNKTGKFVVASSNYILVLLFKHDSNCILVEPMRRCTDLLCILAAVRILHACHVAAGLRSHLYPC
jgi:hypothetical protein